MENIDKYFRIMENMIVEEIQKEKEKVANLLRKVLITSITKN